jgi:hypothetical protein
VNNTVVKDDLVLSACEIGIKAGSEPNRPRVEITAYTGGIMAVPGWGDLAIDLDGLDASGQIALLADHDARVTGVVGHGSAVVRDGRLLVEGVMSGAGDAARQIVEMSSRGFAFQASVGVAPETRERIRPNAAVQVNGRTLSAPRGFMLVRSGRLREVSITPLGADADTSVAIAAARAGMGRITMDTELQLDEQAIRAHERERLTQIEQLCHASSGGGWGTMQSRVNDLRASAIAGDIEIGELSTRLLALLRDSRPRVVAPFERSSPPKVKVIEAALLMRAGMTAIAERAHGAAVMEAADRLGVAHTLDLCRFALEAERIDAPRGREEMVRAALSTFTLPEALGGAASRVLLDGYAETPATWRAFCAIRSVPDFKGATAIKPSFTQPLEPVAPGGELKHGGVMETTAPFSIDTFGRMLSIDRRDLINDDLGVFDEAARAMGQAAMRKLSDLVYDTVLTNAGPFFSSGNANLLTGVDTALGVDSLELAIAAMLTQRDAEGNNLDIRPATLVVPPELQSTARAVLESEFITAPANAPTGNSMRKAVALEVEPRLSNAAKFGAKASLKAWYLFGAASASPVIAAFLNGRQVPTVEYFGLTQDANRLAATWRVYFDFGAALCDPRAAVRAKGEA